MVLGNSLGDAVQKGQGFTIIKVELHGWHTDDVWEHEIRTWGLVAEPQEYSGWMKPSVKDITNKIISLSSIKG